MKLSNLRELNLSGNAIDDLSPKLFEDFAKLKSLDLSSNKLNQHLDPASFTSLPTTIKFLDISSKKLTQVLPIKRNTHTVNYNYN
jgi:Leucine-rich repeat (LRR) protein